MELPPGLKRFAQLERILAVLLVLTPVLLVAVDTGPDDIRSSISAYHDVGTPQAFFVPLTVAAMLFLVNGILRDAHDYNALLGLALAGVILFDHDGWTSVPHYGFALAFFLGNIAVMGWLSTHKPPWLKPALGAGIAMVVALLLLTDWFTVFWAECVSLLVIAAHYFLDSVSWSPYRALRARETVQLAP